MWAAENVGVQSLTIWARQTLHSVLLLSPAEDLSLKVLPRLLAVPKWNLLTNPLSLYGRRVRRTGTAGCTGTTCRKHAKMLASYMKCRRPMQNVGGRRHFDPFSKEKSKT